mmetsp:Transcript_52813/g.99248  ORF Transcript_52813/g.99248 Transcript_52813/m.99248 type:complete len:211 (-) Transcript_52813:1542-2174(-)
MPTTACVSRSEKSLSCILKIEFKTHVERVISVTTDGLRRRLLTKKNLSHTGMSFSGELICIDTSLTCAWITMCGSCACADCKLGEYSADLLPDDSSIEEAERLNFFIFTGSFSSGVEKETMVTNPSSAFGVISSTASEALSSCEASAASRDSLTAASVAVGVPPRAEPGSETSTDCDRRESRTACRASRRGTRSRGSDREDSYAGIETSS